MDVPGHLSRDRLRVPGSHRQQLRLTGALHRHEPKYRFIYGLTDRDQAVVHQHRRLVLTNRCGDAFPFLNVVGDAAVLAVQAVILKEDASILGQWP